MGGILTNIGERDFIDIDRLDTKINTLGSVPIPHFKRFSKHLSLFLKSDRNHM